MKKIITTLLNVIIFILLTFFTQVGGIIYLLSILINNYAFKTSNNNILTSSFKITTFLILYFITSYLIIPTIAKSFGRVPLPFSETNNIKPLNRITFILNRNYVNVELKNALLEVAIEMNKKYPGTTINYLDANFPLLNKFPLLPHLSHNDGKKLDISFCYMKSKTNEPTNESPSFIGYGVSVDPLPNEANFSVACSEKGYWQYGFLNKLVPQHKKNLFKLDMKRTRELVSLFENQPRIQKIFIEPHLKSRLKLNSSKIRFHGCGAVRHDDHLHVQIN